MIQTPGKHVPTIRNRSSKQYYNLTRIGIRHMQEWQKSLGIPQYIPKTEPKTKSPKAE